GGTTTTYNNCTATTQSGYTIPQISHGINNQLVTKTISNGTQDIEVSCNDGTLTYGTETINCENNFIVSGESCVLDTCTGTMPANAELNGTQGTSTWTYSTTPGVCKYTNQTGYHTEDGGTTFVSDTRSCVIANGTGEETWNGSNWGTCTVTSCNLHYAQSGNTCIVTGWRALDSNCNLPDVTIGTQTWAGCNSTLGTGYEWGKQDNGTDGTIVNCYQFGGVNDTPNCSVNSPNMLSTINANIWHVGDLNGDTEVANIWGKFYTWANSSTACPTGRHVPNETEFTALQTLLNAGIDCRSPLYGWRCSGLGWTGHNSLSETENLVSFLKLPLGGYRYGGNSFYRRGVDGYLWMSGQTDYYLKFAIGFSSIEHNPGIHDGSNVRCIKN
ncbi:MAG: FISUMP domain-containing protein, partial [Candidatus Gracilibacteria bacterium]|nr:FISUMP domain-containing protein [Candidatus Gracilibacteria bacterium]